ELHGEDHLDRKVGRDERQRSRRGAGRDKLKRAASLHAVRGTMNTCTPSLLRPRAAQRGFTLVELMVTVGIALFLLGGLVTIVQNVRQTSITQQRLAELQDAQRFALTVITDAVQAAGYFNDPTAFTTGSFPIAGAFGN